MRRYIFSALVLSLAGTPWVWVSVLSGITLLYSQFHLNSVQAFPTFFKLSGMSVCTMSRWLFQPLRSAVASVSAEANKCLSDGAEPPPPGWRFQFAELRQKRAERQNRKHDSRNETMGLNILPVGVSLRQVGFRNLQMVRLLNCSSPITR